MSECRFLSRSFKQAFRSKRRENLVLGFCLVWVCFRELALVIGDLMRELAFIRFLLPALIVAQPHVSRLAILPALGCDKAFAVLLLILSNHVVLLFPCPIVVMLLVFSSCPRLVAGVDCGSWNLLSPLAIFSCLPLAIKLVRCTFHRVCEALVPAGLSSSFRRLLLTAEAIVVVCGLLGRGSLHIVRRCDCNLITGLVLRSIACLERILTGVDVSRPVLGRGFNP
mmetsp:Transcript_26032/g.82632  ORF Transcript_26032/g.82632 Transcript_26032/m.82632 type:complete len:225 (+) Transcript_26032:1617-2291(+)